VPRATASARQFCSDEISQLLLQEGSREHSGCL